MSPTDFGNLIFSNSFSYNPYTGETKKLWNPIEFYKELDSMISLGLIDHWVNDCGWQFQLSEKGKTLWTKIP
jgi:hypothetical protein